MGFDPWIGKISWRRAWQPTPVFLPGESQGQRRCYPEEDSRGPCPFSHSFIHSTVQHSFWNSLPNAALCWGKAMTPSHPCPWDPPEALSTLLGMESRLGPGSSDQVIWLTGYTDWAGRPVMPFIWIKQLVDGERTADMGTYLYNSISPTPKLGSIPQPELVYLRFLFSTFRVAALVSVLFLFLFF